MKNTLPEFHAGAWRGELDESNQKLNVIPAAKPMTLWRFSQIAHRLSDLLIVDLSADALNFEAAQALLLQWRPVIRDLVADGMRERSKLHVTAILSGLFGAAFAVGVLYLSGR